MTTLHLLCRASPARLAAVRSMGVLFFAMWVAGCSTVVSSVSSSFTQTLSDGILNNSDLEMVRDGAPAYLILVDSIVMRAPDNGSIMLQSAFLHSAYASAFVATPQRAKLLHNKAKTQALSAACQLIADGCDLSTRKFADFEAWITDREVEDVPVLYALGTVWAGWLQANSDDFTAIAELSRPKAIMQKIAELDPSYDNGSVFLYLGVFETLLPAAMGGRPEVGRGYFERALALSEERNLMAKVMFAEQYGRLVFDRDLHDRLLSEVVAANAIAPGMTLMNTVAQEQAQLLLESADDYF